MKKIEYIKKKINQEISINNSLWYLLNKNWKRYEKVLEFVLEKHDIKNKKIVDYGCGHPVIAAFLNKLGYNVTAYEPYATNEHFKSAEILGVSHIYKSKLTTADTFDYLIMVEVIEHLMPFKTNFSAILKYLNDNGNIIISTPNGLRFDMWLKFILRKTANPTNINTFINVENNYQLHHREFTQKELKYTMKKFRLMPEYTKIVDTKPSPKYRIQKVLNKKKVFSFQKIKFYSFDFVSRIFCYLFPSIFGNSLLISAKKNNSLR